MKEISTYRFSWLLLVAMAVTMNFAFARSGHHKRDTTAQRNKLAAAKTSYLHNGLHLSLPPLKPAATSSQKISLVRPDDRLLLDVQVFPNPVTDQISIKYSLSHNAIVTVKVMDVLGNDVITLVSQRVESGEQSFSYLIGNKLQRGFYFIRVVAGTESVIKRISVL